MQNHRKHSYTTISNQLASLSDLQIMDLISTQERFQPSIGGKSCMISFSGNSVFVKKLPLTNIERHPENIQSTANLFQLSPSCHYGVGSPGFNAWREIFVHRLSTEWVLTNKCYNFPIMYHWRVLATKKMNKTHRELLEKEILYWKNSSSIRQRVEAIKEATAEIVIFLEYIPQTLHQWFKIRLTKETEISDQAVSFVEQSLKKLTTFTQSQGLIHFDTHFENILTDGNLIYLTDFGLSISKFFDLSDVEKNFFDTHQDYDRYWTLTGLVYSIITSQYGAEDWEFRLEEYLENNQRAFSPFTHSILKQYGPITLKMFDFYKKLKTKSCLVQYPAKDLRRLLIKAADNSL